VIVPLVENVRSATFASKSALFHLNADCTSPLVDVAVAVGVDVDDGHRGGRNHERDERDGRDELRREGPGDRPFFLFSSGQRYTSPSRAPATRAPEAAERGAAGGSPDQGERRTSSTDTAPTAIPTAASASRNPSPVFGSRSSRRAACNSR
jgi:hypothetical protein